MAKLVKVAEWEWKKTSKWNRDELSSFSRELRKLRKTKLKQILAPFFTAITGSSVSLPLFDSLELLGPDLYLYTNPHFHWKNFPRMELA